MRDMLNTLLRILDGSPSPDGERQRGQSLMELLLITPLLIIMIVGIVEIGWYANHYLVLQEVTRVGARAGTVLTGDLSPLSWERVDAPSYRASLHPITYLLDEGYGANPAGSNLSFGGMDVATSIPSNVPTTESLLYRNCDPTVVNEWAGFYNFIACAMVDSLSDALPLRGRAPDSVDVIPRRYSNGPNAPVQRILLPDDIVISVFALQAINNADPATVITANPVTEADLYNHQINLYRRTVDFENDTRINAWTRDQYRRGPQVKVIGRYPANANECNVWFQPNPSVELEDNIINLILAPLAPVDPGLVASGREQLAGAPPNGTYTFDDAYDPFDYIPNDVFDFFFDQGIRLEYELPGFDTGAEFQRGFTWTGQRVVTEYDDVNDRYLVCLGSVFSDEEVEEMMNAQDFLFPDIPEEPEPGTTAWDTWYATYTAEIDQWMARREFLPSQGLVLVELAWNHRTLLDLPFFSPLWQMFGGDITRIDVTVWAAFPVPAAEPNVIYGLP